MFEKADRESRRYGRFALEVLVDAGENPQQRALSGSVQSDDADLGSVEVREIDVLEDGFLVVVLAYSNHGVNDFVRNGAHAEGLSGSETRQRLFLGLMNVKHGVQLCELKEIGNLAPRVAEL